ncbi:MAG: NAD-binding protein [Actinobacteria bacterium]|nr:NAD-binding protein [Actinomycetota bacterium]
MFVVIVGAGKVGLNVARSLTHMGHEFIVIEQRRTRYDLLRPELEERLLFGDGTEMWVLEEAGVVRCDLVVAVTGDDEDNVVIAQLAKLEYNVPKVVARVNNPRNQQTFDLLDVDATVCAATMMISMIQHELPSHQFVPLLSLKRENVELVEIEVSDDSPSAHVAINDIRLPDGVLVTAILREGTALLARGSEVLLPGDQVLCLLAPGRETDLIRSFLPSRRPEDVQAQASIDIIAE